jgi:predicted MPP superfamily phosphohydrolase
MFSLLPLVLLLSQVYWLWRLAVWLNKYAKGRSRRWLIAAPVLTLYLLMIAYAVGWIGGRGTPVHLTPGEILLGGPFAWWIASSAAAFLVVVIFRTCVVVISGAARLISKRAPKDDLELRSPARRQFLERAANVAAAAPFVGGAYGVLYGRLNLETPLRKISIERLPAAFHGFRMAQLSDIHIGPFMTGDEIRKYAAIANSLKPHLILLTGDYVTWDGRTQQAVVDALSTLKAPFGVYGCLGNHDFYANVQNSITGLFGRAGIKILRGEAVDISAGADSFRLIGVDYTWRMMTSGRAAAPQNPLPGADNLVDKAGVNILLSHNPNGFDRAAELGIDLTLSGHTHGGQAALEFISPQLAPSRLVTPYVAGLFEKPGSKLYVNRGIGTIGVPLRIGAPPEITLFELLRA